MGNINLDWQVVRDVSRGLIGLAAGVVAVCALIEANSDWETFLSGVFDGWPSQSLRDFSILMVTYVFLCIVLQEDRDFSFEFSVFAVSFVVWVISILIVIYQPENAAFGDAISLLSVLITIIFAIVGPFWKRDTQFIWQRQR